MADLTVWEKPNGKKISLNNAPATVAEARRLGWKPEGEADTPKRGRPPKTEG